MNAVIEWLPMQREGYEIYAPNITYSSAAGENNIGFDFLKTAIGAEKADAAWRFRFHVPDRGNYETVCIDCGFGRHMCCFKCFSKL